MEFLSITLTGWTAMIITLSMFVLAGVMFVLGSKKVHYVWGLFSLATALWAGGFYMVTLAETFLDAQFWWKISFVGIIFVPFTFLHFVLEFIESKSYEQHKVILLSLIYGVAVFFLTINLSTNLMVDQLTFLFNEVYYNQPAAPLHPYFTFFYISLVMYSYFLVLRAYRKNIGNRLFRSQVKYFFLGTGIGFLGGSMDFLLVYGPDIHPIRNLSVILGAFIVGLAMLRYKLFDVRVVTAQILTFILVAFSFIRLIISKSIEEVIFNVVLLSITSVVGVYLILSVRKEVRQRQEIEQLAKKLQDANVKLKELDKLKSQFLSIASHDLRAPLSSIRNFMSLLLENTYGKLPPAAEDGVRQVFERATEMARMVDDYLNVSRIEQGSMKYDFAPADLIPLVSESVEGLKGNADKKHLDLSFYVPSGIQKIPIKADVGRLREVFNNLIDNSIKYTPSGSIKVFIEGGDNTARVVIQDTGIGITEDTKKNLFKLFSPGQFSRKINPSSTGVGLYVVKKHVEAHGGKVWVDSEGEGKGSRFYVELPITLSPGEATVHKFANDL